MSLENPRTTFSYYELFLTLSPQFATQGEIFLTRLLFNLQRDSTSCESFTEGETTHSLTTDGVHLDSKLLGDIPPDPKGGIGFFYAKYRLKAFSLQISKHLPPPPFFSNFFFIARVSLKFLFLHYYPTQL